MVMLASKYIAYASAALAFMGFLVGLIMASSGSALGFLGAVIAGVCGLFAVLLIKYGYLVMPIITQRTSIVQLLTGGYEVVPSQEAIVRNINNTYYASMFLGVKIYESVTDKTLEENAMFMEYFERAVSSVKYAMKVSMMVYVKDLGEFRKKIETKRAEAQLRLARERDKPEPDPLRIDRYDKEIGMWDGQLGKLSKGVKPMSVVSYVMTTATGPSKEAAVAKAKSQAKELSATLSNALNVEIIILTGEDMLKCFDWEFMIPPSSDEMDDAISM